MQRELGAPALLIWVEFQDRFFMSPFVPEWSFPTVQERGAFALRVALSHVPLQSAALLPDNQSHAATSHTPTLSSPPPLPLG